MTRTSKYPDDMPLDTIMIGGPVGPKTRALMKRYGFEREPDGYHWSRPSDGHGAECDIIMEAHSAECEGRDPDD
jgi:hypothetical protein